jgi:hypothetical protein
LSGGTKTSRNCGKLLDAREGSFQGGSTERSPSGRSSSGAGKSVEIDILADPKRLSQLDLTIFDD